VRPDLVFRSDDRVVAIADTKGKLVGRDSRGGLIPAEADMYQMHAYEAAFQCTDVALVYPWRHELAEAAATEFHLPQVNGRPAIVRVLCIDVHDDALPVRLGSWSQLTEQVTRVTHDLKDAVT
jgi:hypothetical protein